MRAVSRPSLYDYIDAAMTRTHRDAVQIERLTGVPASWTRNLKNGRIQGRPDADRLGKVAQALGLDEAELWAYFGRADMIAAIRAQPADVKEPGAGEPAGLVDAITALTAELTAMRLEREAAQQERANLAERVESLERTIEALAQSRHSEQGGGASPERHAPLGSAG